MIELPTVVTAVTVYPDRARVVRSGAARLEAGVHQLEVTELPLALDPASARVSARGTAGARLLGVEVTRRFYAETPAERVRELEKQVEALGDEKRSLDAQSALLEQEHAALGALAGQVEPFARGLAFGKTSVDDQMALFDRLRRRVEEINGALLDLMVKKRDLERRLQKAQLELDQVRAARGRERYAAVIELEASQAGEWTIELSYVVSNAAWQPLYDLRLLEDEGKAALEVRYLAQVTQRTGEDWPAVTLTLSTARPALAGELPELDPWYIGPLLPPAPRFERRAARVAAAPVQMAEAALGAQAEAEATPSLEADVATATVDASGASVAYRVPVVVSVPADGAPRKVAAACYTLAAELDYVTAPKLVEAVYRRAQATNDSPYTLLPGPASLFVGDEFVGSTKLELVPPHGEIELYLGVDDRIEVERELKRREVDKKLIGDRRRLCYGYAITLRNRLPATARVTLHDQMPVARHEEIRVRLESADPRPSEQTELNLLNWELLLAPGEERVVRFDFTVEHPRGMVVTGLP